MSNRFTEQLLALPSVNSVGFDWLDLLNVSAPLFSALVHFNPADDIVSEKSILICFVAAMSDEDLAEVFGV